MATPAPRHEAPAIPPSPRSAVTTKIPAVRAPEDSQPAAPIERSPSSWPASAQEEAPSSLIDAGGPPSTRYRLIAPRPGKRVPRT